MKNVPRNQTYVVGTAISLLVPLYCFHLWRPDGQVSGGKSLSGLYLRNHKVYSVGTLVEVQMCNDMELP